MKNIPPGSQFITSDQVSDIGTKITQDDFDATKRDKVVAVSNSLASSFGIGPGDLMYINVTRLEFIQFGINPHVVMIVGWGPYLTTWNTNFIGATFSVFPTRQATLDAGYQFPVLYVVDHGHHGQLTLDAFPRPYYALWWLPPGKSGLIYSLSTEKFSQEAI